MIARLLFAIVWLSLLACGGIQSKQANSNVTEHELPPVVVKPWASGNNLSFYDAKELFDRGRLARAFDKYSDCIRFFSLVREEFPKSKYAEPALYNRGLCYESIGDPHSAAEDFQKYTQIVADDTSKLDGSFRLLHNLVEIEHNTKALALVEELLKIRLDDLDRAELLSKKGIVFVRLNQQDQARSVLLKASRLARDGARGIIHENPVYAESEFHLGSISLTRMTETRLRLPLERMKKDLGVKLQHFRKSQLHLLNSVKSQVKGVSTRAGEKLGALYACLYTDLLDAEKPLGLSNDEIEVYYEELINRVQPVLRNAIKIYEKSLDLGKRLGETPEWINTVNQQKIQLEALLKNTTKDRPTQSSQEVGQSQ